MHLPAFAAAVKAVGAVAAANELTSLPSPAPALAFLASTIKDYGAVTESSELLRMCLDLKPESTAYVLNYVHVLEVENRYEDVRRTSLSEELF